MPAGSQSPRNNTRVNSQRIPVGSVAHLDTNRIGRWSACAYLVLLQKNLIGSGHKYPVNRGETCAPYCYRHVSHGQSNLA